MGRKKVLNGAFLVKRLVIAVSGHTYPVELYTLYQDHVISKEG
jgi:hypothetical protein